jgi:predicted phage tail protein
MNQIFRFLGRWVPAGTSKEPKINLENLAPGKEYKFRVKAVNSEGASEPLEAETPILAKSKYGKYCVFFVPYLLCWLYDRL